MFMGGGFLLFVLFFAPAHSYRRQSESIQSKYAQKSNPIMFLSVALITTREQKPMAASPETK